MKKLIQQALFALLLAIFLLSISLAVVGVFTTAYYAGHTERQSLAWGAGVFLGLFVPFSVLFILFDRQRIKLQPFEPTNLPEKGEFERWRESLDAEKYRGMSVAFIEGKGVVASSKELDKLTDMLNKLGRPRGVVIGYVPN